MIGAILRMNSNESFHRIRAFAVKKNLPMIPLNPLSVSFIDGPNSYYQSICDLVKRSTSRINLSALYLGTDNKEKALLDSIGHHLNSNPSLEVTFTLDSKRATRRDKLGRSSVTSLEGLIGLNRTSLRLVNTSSGSIFAKFINLFQRWNEIVSTYHTKFLVFDNDIILTGANLSSVYFEARQDRYLLVKDSRKIADYISDYLDIVGTCTTSFTDELFRLNQTYCKDNHDDQDTYVIPLVQFGKAGITDKEDFLMFLESIRPQGSKSYLSSGYFNPSPALDSMEFESILIASENANNFSGSSGLSKFIPKLYLACYERYKQRHSGCDICLYDKTGWSFHAKGLWFEEFDGLYIHLIGSSNYNFRSSQRDLETQMVIITKNEHLISMLKNERIQLWQGSRPIQKADTDGLNIIQRLCSRLFVSLL